MCAPPHKENFNKFLTVNTLNVNGWTENNGRLRLKLITHNEPDIVCITETHLKNDEQLELDEYICFTKNRKVPTG